MQAVKWGEYRLGDLFEAQTGDVDLQQKDCNGKGEYLVNSGLDNCGIKGRTNRPAKVFPANTITVDFWGNAFYRNFKYKMATHNHVFSLSGKVIKNESVGIFIATQFSYMRKLFSFDYMGTWNKIKELKILLPTTANNEIDFDFMESFIRELEEERIRELSAYLTVSGLSDTKLSDREEAALLQFKNFDWQEFNVTDIFNVKNTHNILSSEIVENSGEIPYLCASAENNGVSSYISFNADFLEEGNCIFIGGKTFVVSYQKDDFFSNDSHNLALYLKDEDVTKENQLYLASCVTKSLSHKYSWGNSISNAKIKNDKIMLPVKDGNPDYASMETFISAVQKLVIKDVVQYADKKIAATKDVVSKETAYQIPESYGALKVAEPELPYGERYGK